MHFADNDAVDADDAAVAAATGDGDVMMSMIMIKAMTRRWQRQ